VVIPEKSHNLLPNFPRQDRNRVVAEYALRGVTKPIGISEYELTRALPPGLKSALPTVEQIEAELAGAASVPASLPKPKPGRKAKPARKSQQKQDHHR
jgi:hypothetical protein